MEENKLALALSVYRTICTALDNRDWKYRRDDEKQQVYFSVNGEDIPIGIIFEVDADRQLIRLYSVLPFKMSEEKRMDGALACLAASNAKFDGSFDYNMENGQIVFRLSECFVGCEIGEGLVQYMISCAYAVVEEYNDKLLAINKGLLSVSDFIKAEE